MTKISVIYEGERPTKIEVYNDRLFKELVRVATPDEVVEPDTDEPDWNELEIA